MGRKLRTVLAGCGGISGAWFRSAQQVPAIDFVGLMDIREEAAAKRKEEFALKNAVTGTDLGAMLKQLRPDVVFDCTVPEAHAEVVIQALRHGCHVLGEKPMADTLANARRMVAAAKRARRIYAVTQNYRYNPNIRALVRFIASGRIGRVTTVNCDFYLGPHFGGFRDEMMHVLLLDMAIHTFDASRLISGADPLAVYCKDWNPSGSWYADGASAAAIFEMTGGVVLNYRGSWCANGLNTPWNSVWRIIGEHGTVTWDGGDGFQAQVVESKKGFIPPPKDVKVSIAKTRKDGGHLGIMREFADGVLAGKAPETVCTDNVKSLAMVFAAIESSECGKRVKVRI